MTTRRLAGYDYRAAGSYFVTICTATKALLSESPAAINIIERMWAAIPQHFAAANIDVFVVMPIHVHGIVHLDEPVAVWHANRYRLASWRVR